MAEGRLLGRTEDGALDGSWTELDEQMMWSKTTALELTLRGGHVAAGLPHTHAGDSTGHLACGEHLDV